VDEAEPGAVAAHAVAPTPRSALSPWGDLPPVLRAAEQGTLSEFVDCELRVGWPEAASLLVACWGAHSDVVLQLRFLRQGLRWALIPELNEDGTVGTGHMERIEKWYEELRHDQDRWVESFRAGHGSKPCPRMEPLEDPAGEAVAWHAKEVKFAFRAWGQEPILPERYLEPYEQAASGANHRASRGNDPGPEAPQYDGDPGPGGADPFPTW
jgi:hypothetical protein